MKRIAAIVACLLAVTLCTGVRGTEAAKQKRSTRAAAAVPAREVLAWVGNEPITRAEFEARVSQLSPQFRQQFGTAEGKQQLLDRMIEEKVWMRAAERAGVPQRPEVKQQLEQDRLNVIIRSYLTELMQGAGAPGDSAVRAYYEQHKQEPQFQLPPGRKVREIQLASEKDARDALARLRKGADFGALARQLSKDTATRDSGGVIERVERLGPFGALGRQPALAETVFTAPLHAMLGPVKSTVGWHVVEVLDTIPAEPQPFETVRPRLVQMLSRQTQEDYYKAQLEQVKKAEGLRMNKAVVDSFLYGQRSSSDLFREAQDAADADERIAAYERVVQQYPRSEQAPQAQFMIGFVYSEEKKDYDKAQAAFEKLLTDYPKSELRNSAQWMLDNMRSDAVPNFQLPGGVKRATAAPRAPGTEAPPPAAGSAARVDTTGKK